MSTQRKAAADKKAKRAAKQPSYYAGDVTEVIDSTHCKVAYLGRQVVCFSGALVVLAGWQVRVRAMGNDYRIDAVLSVTDRVDFTTTSPAGAGWYKIRPDGDREVCYWTTGTIAATTVAEIIYLPEEFWPVHNMPIPAVSGTNPRQASSEIGPDGRWRVYNGQTSATTVYVHGIYPID